MIMEDDRYLCGPVIQAGCIGLILIFKDACEPLRLIMEGFRIDNPEMTGPDLPPFQVSRILPPVIELGPARH